MKFLLLTHYDENMDLCDICFKHSYRTCSLQYDVKVEKPYKCDICYYILDISQTKFFHDEIEKNRLI